MNPFKLSTEVNKSVMRPESHDKNKAKTDEDRLLQIFPAEIWLKVVRAARPYDLLNIRQSTYFLHTLLTPIEFLFAPVLKCILPYIPDEYNRKCLALKNCRLVRRSWCKAVNSILQEESLYTRLDTGRFTIPPEYPYYIQHFFVKFLDFQKMFSRFESHFRDTHFEKGKNPFVSRHVEIRGGNLHCRNLQKLWEIEYLPHLYKILTKCGHHIWYLNISMLVSESSKDFQGMRVLLGLLPNLKVLTVRHVPIVSSTKAPVPNPEPFRHLQNLQCVKTYGDQSEALLKALLAKNPQVKFVTFNQHKWGKSGNDWMSLAPNLERLKVTSFKMSDIQQMCSVHVNWPLKQLVANFVHVYEAVKWQEMGRYFQILETNFANTLEELDLYLPHIYERNTNITLYLPRLTSLSLKLTSCFSLDIILPMKKNLKYLEIRVECSYSSRQEYSELAAAIQENTIKFFTVYNPPMNTNIWVLFPKLETLKYWHIFDHHKEILYTRRNVLMD